MNLLGATLRDVSRSFYVSIKLLPRNLRKPVGLAYLLARATDTLADTPDISATIRADSLRTLASAIQNGSSSKAMVDLINSFAPLQTNESEKVLIRSLPQCLLTLEELDVADQQDVRQVLSTINRGQMLDIERPALATAAELNEYTYLVGGCVGEFWTNVCFRHVENLSERPQSEMIEIGIRYGQGLQLINILRDAGNDLKNGRCYFPEEELNAIGLSASQIIGSPEPFMVVFRKWLDEAQRRLESGMDYVVALRNRRVRAATAVPALIGAGTLALLRSQGHDVFRERVKVPRREVRGIIGTVTLTLANRGRLQRMFRRFLS